MSARILLSAEQIEQIRPYIDRAHLEKQRGTPGMLLGQLRQDKDAQLFLEVAFVENEHARLIEGKGRTLIEDTDPRVRPCSSCGARIVFLPTASGKRCPTNAETVEPQDAAFVWGKHVSHFSTCPNAHRHRSPR